MGTAKEEWIGVAEVAAEMNYTTRQAWEFIRKIGLTAINSRKMELIRFTRTEFQGACERAMAPIESRIRTGAVPAAAKAAKKPGGAGTASVASKLAKLRGA